MRMYVHIRLCLYFNALAHGKSIYKKVIHMGKKRSIAGETVKNIKIKSNMWYDVRIDEANDKRKNSKDQARCTLPRPSRTLLRNSSLMFFDPDKRRMETEAELKKSQKTTV